MSAYETMPSAAIFQGVRYRTDGSGMYKDVGLGSYNWGVPIPATLFSAAEASGGTMEAGVYQIHMVYRNQWGRIGNPNSSGPVSVTLSSDNYKISLTNIPASGDAQVSHIYFYSTTPDADSPFYYIGNVANGTTTLSVDSHHDNWDTANYLEPGYLTQDFEGTLAGPFRYRGPALKRYVEVFDDRIFCAGELVYASGLASATAGSTTMTGSGGMSLNSNHIGKWITLNNESTAYRITAITSATEFTVDRAYVLPSWRSENPADVEYAITGYVHEVIFSEQGEPEYYPSINSFYAGRDEGGHITGLKTVGEALIIATDRSLFRVYITGNPYQPYGIKRTNSPVGCTANKSMVVANGGLFFWGGDGFYAFANNTSVNISEPALGQIQRDMKEELLPYITGCYHDEKIYWAVPYGDDNYLDRMLVYDLRTKEWDLPWKTFQIIDMQSAIAGTGVKHLLLTQKTGESYSLHCFDWDCYNDGAYNADYSGTADSATATTLTDASAAFVTGGCGLAGVPVYIRSGTGYGQERRIYSNTSTVLSIGEPWDTIPDDTSTYVIGVPRYRGTSKQDTLGAPYDEKTFRLSEFGLEVTTLE